MVVTPGLQWWAAIPPELHLKRSDLCGQCAAIDFRAAFILPDKGEDRGHKYIHIHEQDSNDSTCQFCRYLAYARRRGPPLEDDGKYVIIFHTDPEPIKLMLSRDKRGSIHPLSSVYITIVPPRELWYENSRTAEWDSRIPEPWNTSIICHLGKPLRLARSPQIVSPVFDNSLARAWFDACARNHPECAVNRHSQMPKTKLIDCERRKLVSVGGHGDTQMRQFVALSYVWGQPTKALNGSQVEPRHSTAAEDLRSDLPRTIDDAVTVTKALGFQYLWVDQYCIDQEDDEDKTRQVAHMDLIYRFAELTIIAAAGEDCWHGLPGVRGCPRDVLNPFILDLGDGRPALTFGTLNCPPLVEGHWRSGKWHTRGWTFQEAHMSRRRLVFSDTQMHFECSYGEAQTELSGGVECAPGPSKSDAADDHWIHTEHTTGSHTFSKPGAVDLDWGCSPGHEKLAVSIRLYTELVAQYTTRNLLWPSDGLNAFRGAANVLQLADPRRYPVYSVAGVPFALGDESSGRHSLAEDTFSYGLAWQQHSRKQSSPGAPDWIFPSWSWANVSMWNVVWHSRPWPQWFQRSVFAYPRNVRIEFKGMEQLVSLDEFAEACRERRPLSRLTPKALCVKARMLSARVVSGYHETTLKHGQLSLYGNYGNDYCNIGRTSMDNRLHLAVNTGVAADEKQDDPGPVSSGVQPLGDFHGSCFVSPEDIRFAIQSGRCSLLLLRYTSEEAIALLIKWLPEVDEKTACRVGTITFVPEAGAGGEIIHHHVEKFLSFFSVEKEVRLI